LGPTSGLDWLGTEGGYTTRSMVSCSLRSVFSPMYCRLQWHSVRVCVIHRGPWPPKHVHSQMSWEMCYCLSKIIHVWQIRG